MFNMFKSKKAEVLSHWYTLVPNFNTSTQEFYKSVEADLKARQVPGMDLSPIEFKEGGVLSDERTYLRMMRERLVFDVCAAPFGTSYFFSCRFAELPLAMKLSDLIFLTILPCVLLWVACHYLGIVLGPLALVFVLGGLASVLHNAVAMGLKDLDAWLIKSPLGTIYELWFRKETYYRVDTRLMYHDSVNDVIKAQVEAITCAKGVKLIHFNEYDPILADLYVPTQVKLPRPPA